MIIENNPLTLRSLLRLFMNCENRFGLIYKDSVLLCPFCLFSLCIWVITGGHTSSNNAPPMCPPSPITQNKLENRG